MIHISNSLAAHQINRMFKLGETGNNKHKRLKGADIMDERELRTLIEKVNQLTPEGSDKMQKVEYMMDFGSVAVMINVSLN